MSLAQRDGNGYVMSGVKSWITNARRASLIALLCKTDPRADPAHGGIGILLVEKGPSLTVSRNLPKLGYKGVESCELASDGFRTLRSSLLGGVEGRGFAQQRETLG